MPTTPKTFSRLRVEQQDKQRGSACARGYDRKWQKASKAFLLENPLCAWCEGDERTTAAELVDHTIPHRGNMTLFWDMSNWAEVVPDVPRDQDGKGDPIGEVGGDNPPRSKIFGKYLVDRSGSSSTLPCSSIFLSKSFWAFSVSWYW